jgi:transcriptional regulator with XRE-family HTH domain
MSSIYKTIGEKLRELRSHHNGRGVSQETLATELGTTPNTISRWETATYKPSVSDLEKLAHFFGVPIATFFPGMEPDVRAQALLSATRDLNKTELDELTRYAQFRRARRELKTSKKTRTEK